LESITLIGAMLFYFCTLCGPLRKTLRILCGKKINRKVSPGRNSKEYAKELHIDVPAL